MTRQQQQIRRQILGVLGCKANRAMSFNVVLNEIDRRAAQGDLPYACRDAAYGIAYARQTARISGLTEMKLRTLGTVGQVADLVAAIAIQDTRIADVARFLNDWAA